MLKRIWDKIVETWLNIPEKIQKLIIFLKENGFFDNVIEFLKKIGISEAESICEIYIIDEKCDNPLFLVNKILRAIMNIFK